MRRRENQREDMNRSEGSRQEASFARRRIVSIDGARVDAAKVAGVAQRHADDPVARVQQWHLILGWVEAAVRKRRDRVVDRHNMV
jgi:hypothetical protein